MAWIFERSYNIVLPDIETWPRHGYVTDCLASVDVFHVHNFEPGHVFFCFIAARSRMKWPFTWTGSPWFMALCCICCCICCFNALRPSQIGRHFADDLSSTFCTGMKIVVFQLRLTWKLITRFLTSIGSDMTWHWILDKRLSETARYCNFGKYCFPKPSPKLTF